MTRRVGLSGVLRLRVAYLSVSEGEVLGSEERRSNSCAFVGTFVFDREIYELAIMLDVAHGHQCPLSKPVIPICVTCRIFGALLVLRKLGPVDL